MSDGGGVASDGSASRVRQHQVDPHGPRSTRGAGRRAPRRGPRDRHDKKLVALRLTRGPGHEYLLEVAKQLDGSVPAPAGACPRCSAPLRSWGRFCTQCGFDHWTGSPGEQSAEELLAAVKQATAGKFDILGQMSRARGGGVVYFAREIATGKVEALRLRQERDQGYSIGLTNVLQRALDPPAPDQSPRTPRRPK